MALNHLNVIGTKLFNDTFPVANFLYDISPAEYAKKLARSIRVGGQRADELRTAFSWASTPEKDSWWRRIDALSYPAFADRHNPAVRWDDTNWWEV